MDTNIMIPKYKHSEYYVDDIFKRVPSVRLDTVSQLTELQAKDLCCNLMDCIQKLQAKAIHMTAIFEEYNF